jgi:hypothetical protein
MSPGSRGAEAPLLHRIRRTRPRRSRRGRATSRPATPRRPPRWRRWPCRAVAGRGRVGTGHRGGTRRARKTTGAGCGSSASSSPRVTTQCPPGRCSAIWAAGERRRCPRPSFLVACRCSCGHGRCSIRPCGRRCRWGRRRCDRRRRRRRERRGGAPATERVCCAEGCSLGTHPQCEAPSSSDGTASGSMLRELWPASVQRWSRQCCGVRGKWVGGTPLLPTSASRWPSVVTSSAL